MNEIKESVSLHRIGTLIDRGYRGAGRFLARPELFEG